MKNNSEAAVCIAGLRFDLHGSLPMLNEFVCHSKETGDGQIICVSEPLFDGTERTVANHGDIAISVRNDGSWIYVAPAYSDMVQLILSADYKTISLYVENPQDKMLERVLRCLFRMAFETVAIFHLRVSLHSSCIDAGGEAVAFTGVSGIGKSTRAGAWTQAVGAQFISGDRPALSIGTDGINVYGVPWDGKEQLFRSVQRPLKAILDVRRSDSVYLRRLTHEQAQKVLAKQIFVPMWDTNAAAAAIMNIRKLAGSIPVYRLFCGPDAESAKQAYDILFNNPHGILQEEKDMKIKEGFVLRNVADEFLVMPTGSNIAKFDGAIALNDVSAFIFEQLKNPVSKEDLLIALLNEYEVDKETAEKDIDALIAKFNEMGIIE